MVYQCPGKDYYRHNTLQGTQKEYLQKSIRRKNERILLMGFQVYSPPHIHISVRMVLVKARASESGHIQWHLKRSVIKHHCGQWIL